MGDNDSGVGGWKDWLRSRVTPYDAAKPIGQRIAGVQQSVNNWAENKLQNTSYGRAMRGANDRVETLAGQATAPSVDSLKRTNANESNRAARLEFAAQPAPVPQDKRNAIPAPDTDEAALDAEGEKDRLAYDAAHTQTVHQANRPGMMGSSPQSTNPGDILAHAKQLVDTQASQHQALLGQGAATGDRDAAGGRIPDWVKKSVVDSHGAIERGNINYRGREEIDNGDGTTSTVRSMSFNDGPGREVLVPTAYDGSVHSDEDSMRNYDRTGKHMGVFATPDDATEEALKVHDDYENGEYK